MTSLASALVASKLSLGDLYGGHVPLAATCLEVPTPSDLYVVYTVMQLKSWERLRIEVINSHINSTYQSHLRTSQARWISAMHAHFFGVFGEIMWNSAPKQTLASTAHFSATNQISHPGWSVERCQLEGNFQVTTSQEKNSWTLGYSSRVSKCIATDLKSAIASFHCNLDGRCLLFAAAWAVFLVMHFCVLIWMFLRLTLILLVAADPTNCTGLKNYCAHQQTHPWGLSSVIEPSS